MVISTSDHYQCPHAETGFRAVEFESWQELKEIARKDFSPSLFREGHRKSSNFISSEFLYIDIDSGISMQEFIYRNNGIYMILLTSRNHQKEKLHNGKSEPACDRFHVLFPLEKPIYDANTYKEALANLHIMFPYADHGAKDAARFFFGVDNVDIQWFKGKYLKPRKTEFIYTSPFEGKEEKEQVYAPFTETDKKEIKAALLLGKDKGLFESYDAWLYLLFTLKVSGFSYNDLLELSTHKEQPDWRKTWKTQPSRITQASAVFLAKKCVPDFQFSTSRQPVKMLGDGVRARIDVTCEDPLVLVRSVFKAFNKYNEEILPAPSVFIYNGIPVRINSTKNDIDNQKKVLVDTLNEKILRAQLIEAIEFYTISKEKIEKPCNPPRELVENTLHSANLPFPLLNRIVSGPAFDLDGKLCSEPGYHKTLKTLITEKVEVEGFQGTAKEAADWLLLELACDFPFESEIDKTNFLGFLLTCFCRDMIRGSTPLFLVESSQPGVGKTKLSDIVYRAAFGENGVSSISEGIKPEDMHKQLTSSMLEGKSGIRFDNLKHGLDSPDLARLLTEEYWHDRMLGTNKNAIVKVNQIFSATGNNPTLSTEMARRIINIRLLPTQEDPEERTGFRHDNIISWCDEHRGTIVGAVDTIVSSWVRSGRKSSSAKSFGSFESFNSIISSILEHCGRMDFNTNHKQLTQRADTERNAWKDIVEKWAEEQPRNSLTTSQIYEQFAKNIEGLSLSGESDASKVKSFGRKLSKKRDCIISGYVLEYFTSHHQASYRIRKAGPKAEENVNNTNSYNLKGTDKIELEIY